MAISHIQQLRGLLASDFDGQAEASFTPDERRARLATTGAFGLPGDCGSCIFTDSSGDPRYLGSTPRGIFAVLADHASR